ncbi:uncharacterized protein A4U43_C01F23510 [Asparagus officinalis]|uniref:Uncharacterized protein n=1 Tax=Asparagus officinalis TaxID=4686 RepID=A0A5P1FVT6_ASPOF|nr:uncharacterized protein A4U43_C01F23510 [Asparagus officinalis]
MHIVGMHAHAAAHRHSHAHGDVRACQGRAHDGHGHVHEDDGHVSSHVRHVVVSQAQFKNLSATLMACAYLAIRHSREFAFWRHAISSAYNAHSPRALVIEGILDSISAGILIYMALVDLIAADFLSRRMSCNVRLQVASYLALFLGALSMSSLAIWA